MISWNHHISNIPGASAHIFQSQNWADNKAQTSWEPFYKAWYPKSNSYQMNSYSPEVGQPSAAVLLLRRRIKVAGFAARAGILYAPKGPLLDWSNDLLRNQVLDDLAHLAKRLGGIFIKIDPDLRISTGYPDTDTYRTNPTWGVILPELQRRGWCASKEQIQFKNTIRVDLSASEDELLAKMKQKTRYNIRLAERKGVSIRIGTIADLALLYQMYAETSVRDHFVIREPSYYLNTWRAFITSGYAEPLIAEVDQQPIAAVIIFRFANQAWYIYGMSRDVHREKMPNHLLQWEAIRRAKAEGCVSYDLWGAPDELVETDPLWGVYRFKEGLGGKVIRTMGAWDLPVQPTLYHIYTETLPRVLNQMRQRGKRRTIQEIKS